MGFTNFPNGITSFGIPIYGGGVPIGVGNVYHLVTAKTSSDLFYTRLRDNGADENNIFTSLLTAEAAITSGQNDALLVYPGNHLVTSEITWDKDASWIIGAGSPNQAYQPTTLTTGGIRFTCTTANVGSILNITGNYVSMIGIGTHNNANDADNLADIKLVGRNFYAEGCSFRGGNGAAQLAATGSGVPIIVYGSTTGGGNAARFVNCVIGSSGNSARTYGPGCMSFIAGANAGFGISFKGCRFSTRIETASTNNVCQIRLEGNGAVDRELYFDDCLFYNFSENHGTQLVAGIDDECGTTHSIILKNCAYHGMDAICNVATHCFTADPIAHTNGSEALATVTS
jgi:hypothetical protein